MRELLASTSSYNRVGYGPWFALLWTAGVYFIGSLVLMLILGGLIVELGWNEEYVNQLFESNIWFQFGSVAITEAVGIVTLWALLKWRKTSWSALGLVRPERRDALLALKAYVIYFAAFLVVSIFISIFVPQIDLEQEQELGFARDTVGPALILVFLSLSILPPMIEEILYRGFLYSGLRRKLPVAVAASITAITFSMVHLQFETGNALLWAAAIDTLMLSFVLTYLREKTGSLWSAIGVHFMKNTLAFTFIFIAGS